jgi:CubicO group peptidase (beta-lactamase class C family)
MARAVVEDGEVVEEDEPEVAFQAASLAKPLTACAVMQYVERGELELDAPLDMVVRGWRPGSEEVSLRRVLSHCAGLSNPDYPGIDPALPVPSVLASLRGATGLPLRQSGEPGRFSYSGGGFALLQLLIEEHSGTSFAEHMRAAVLEPAGMRRSTFDQEAKPGRATGHDARGKPLPFYRFDAAAAAGLIATAGDLARFLAAFMKVRIVSAPSRMEMIRPAAHTRGEEDLWPQYGLGWEIDEGGIVGHHGVNRGFRALMAADLEARRAIVLLGNRDDAMPALEKAYRRWRLS